MQAPRYSNTNTHSHERTGIKIRRVFCALRIPTATDIMTRKSYSGNGLHVRAHAFPFNPRTRSLPCMFCVLLFVCACVLLCALNVSVSGIRTHLAHVLCFLIEARCRAHKLAKQPHEKQPFLPWRPLLGLTIAVLTVTQAPVRVPTNCAEILNIAQLGKTEL